MLESVESRFANELEQLRLPAFSDESLTRSRFPFRTPGISSRSRCIIYISCVYITRIGKIVALGLQKESGFSVVFFLVLAFA